MCSHLWFPVSVATSRLRLKLNIDKEFFRHLEIFEATIVGIYDKKWGKLDKAFNRLRQGKTIKGEEVFPYLKGKHLHIRTPSILKSSGSFKKIPLKRLRKINW